MKITLKAQVVLCVYPRNYFRIKARKAEITNKTAIAILAIKSVFSKPRLVWKAELKLSPPPKAPPREALVR